MASLRELAQKIIASQMDIEEKRQRTDWVLQNDSDEQNLYRQMDALLDTFFTQLR